MTMRNKLNFTLLFLFISFLSYPQSYNWNEDKLKAYWRINGAEEIEGIYIRSRTMTQYNALGQPLVHHFVSEPDFYIVKFGEEYIISSLTDDSDFTGKIKKAYGTNKYFVSTNLNYLNIGNEKKTLTMSLTNSNELVLEDVVYVENSVVHGVRISRKNVWSDTFTLIYKPESSVKPKSTTIPESTIKPSNKKSGTGFAVTSDGIIVTNFHVIDGANVIRVRGINSDFYRTYSAYVLLTDTKNDLALIKIDDSKFSSLNKIPYVIKSNISDIGESVFVLGYPLRSSMGDEIKLTNGIISSRTGFQDDITSYQITAAIQPGNSGGPLFNSQGNIIGIINAKHIGAENASYAIKASYLTNLISSLSFNPKLQTINSLNGKSLPQQVGLVKEFIYIIETE